MDKLNENGNNLDKKIYVNNENNINENDLDNKIKINSDTNTNNNYINKEKSDKNNINNFNNTQIKDDKANSPNEKEVEDEDEDDKNCFFHIFYSYINDLWNYFLLSSFIPSYFFENCKIINIKSLDNVIKENDILELQFQEKNIKIKIIIEEIVDTQNYKSFNIRAIEVPEGISSFTINISIYFCSIDQYSGVNIKINSLEPEKDTFIYNYIFENHKKIFEKIEKLIEKNFKDYEQSESINIDNNGDDVWKFLIKNNYSNLKILLGNNASVKTTNIPNEIEIEHFTKNNIVKMMVSKNKHFNEKNLLLQVVSSTKPIPKQSISIKIININNNCCLLFFTHKIKQYFSSYSINNYSLIKKKTLWLLKSTIESK